MRRRLSNRRDILTSLAAGLATSLTATQTTRPAFGQTAKPTEIDLALVLAADCSGSVREEHYDLQQRGYADAFRHPKVVDAILSGLHGAVAICYFQWSGPDLYNLALPWALLRNRNDVLAFGAALGKVPRSIFGGGTAPGEAIDFGRQQLQSLPWRVTRRVIDISGDGRNNRGQPPAMARDKAVAAGITINGLPILHMEADIDSYYEQNIIGGSGAFIMPARDYASFADAIRRKLILEIAAQPPGGRKQAVTAKARDG